MGYKIYTYANPFKLNEAHFWNDIKGYPHICTSQVLVEGLKDVYGRAFAPFIYTMDSVLKKVYPNWNDDVEFKINQFVKLSSQIDTLKIDEKIRRAYKFNIHEILDSIRFIQELNIDTSCINDSKINNEQKDLINIYESLLKKHSEYFKISNKANFPELKNAFLELLKEEIDEREREYLERLEKQVEKLKTAGRSGMKLRKETKRLEKQQKKVKFLEDIQAKWSNPLMDNEINFKKIIIHGIHRFNPMIVRFINELESLNPSKDFEIIFLYNYEPKFSEIYNTWDKVYSQWDEVANIKKENDAVNTNYKRNTFDINETYLGESIGNLLEGNFEDIKRENIEYLEFDNNTSFANYVAKFYEDTKDENNHYSLGKMSEQFYSSNNEAVNDILKVYYPEQFGDRHFLAYPVGQLIISLYNMWDEKDKELKIKPSLLKECLNTNLFSIGNKKLSDIYNSIELYFKDVESYIDYANRIDHLIENLQLIQSNDDADMRKFSFYSKDIEDVRIFNQALELLNDLAKELFKVNVNEDIDFKEHFELLIRKIKDEMSKENDINKEEKEVINSLIDRFENFENLNIKGSITDLKESIHYYLRQKKNHDPAKWIVRNFEQIDGDVLRSLKQSDVTYHFAGLSEKHMQIKVNDQLSWPLTENFFRDAYEDENTHIKIVLNSYKEYKNFLRYSLFYGVYYVKQSVKLSYVKNEENEKEQPYFLLELLGIKPKKFDEEKLDPTEQTMKHRRDNIKELDIKNLTFNREDLQTYKMCEYRYLLDRVIEDGGFYKNEYLCGLYYEILLYEAVLNSITSNLSLIEVQELIRSEEDRLKQYFPFWKDEIDFYDKRQKVLKWVTQNNYNYQINLYTPKSYDESYLAIKKHFIYAKLTDNESNENKVGYLHSFRRYPNNKNAHKDTINDLKEFIYTGLVNSNNGIWCDICKQREVCLEGYKGGEDN